MRYFLDTEFDGMGGPLISLAMVSEGGRELYLSRRNYTPKLLWVKQNVMPIIECPGAVPQHAMLTEFSHNIERFFTGDAHPEIIADWPDDVRYLCELLVTGPGYMIDVPSMRFQVLRVDAYPTPLPGAVQHNALWDARALRHKVMSA